MKILVSIFAVLIGSLFAQAQPWQWQQYEGDYYNPTNFPSSEFGRNFYDSNCEVGYFVSPNVASFLGYNNGQVVLATRIPGEIRWNTHYLTQDLTNGSTCRGMMAMHLDWDGVEEFVVFCDTILAWDIVSSDPLVIQPVPLPPNTFFFPPDVSDMVYCNLNGDTQQEAVCYCNTNTGQEIRFYHNQSGNWTLDSTWDVPWFVGMTAGDFDNDNDTDFAVVNLVLDGFPYSVIYENTGAGLTQHDPFQWASFYFAAGGDLDGDGNWEGIMRSLGSPGLVFAEIVPSPFYFITLSETIELGRIPGPVLGNFHSLSGNVVASVFSFSYFGIAENRTFRSFQRALDRWLPSSVSFSGDTDALILGGNIGDANGDSYRDIVTTMQDRMDRVHWRLWKNVGSESADSFTTAPPNAPRIYSFSSRTDTIFRFPQLGDVNGNGGADLLMLAIPAGSDGGTVRIYEFFGNIEDTTFWRRPEWEPNITDCRKLAAADLDNDGLVELCLRVGTETAWRSYFYREGQWQRMDVLPAVAADSISFADADNDGDLDLFTPDQLWYSLSPSASDRNVILHPSSFSLSASPNPFNARTEMTFTLTESGHISLELFDIIGRHILTMVHGTFAAGEHSVPFDGSNLGSGIYFARLSAPHRQTALKLVLIR